MKRLWNTSLATKPERRFVSLDFVLGVSAVVWLIVVSLGLGLLMRYANRPGDQGSVSAFWPDNALVQRSRERPSVVLFAHPRCPCTHATLKDLEWVMDRCDDGVDCHVVFFQAETGDEEWSKTSYWNFASAIEGVTVTADVGSQMASLFGVQTSGHVLLYDRDGGLLFEGGITPSRGHSGSNPGRTALLDLIQDHGEARDDQETLLAQSVNPGIRSTCVFGCSLHAPELAAPFVAASKE